MKKLLFAGLLFLSVTGAGLGIYNYQQQSGAPAYGTFNPVGGQTYTTKGSIGSTNTTIPLSSFTEPLTDTPYTMAYLSTDIGYGTLAPQTSSAEFISFTGITQNADGTATLTGVVRGLAPSYPFTASSDYARPHAGQTQFILSNTPQFYNEFAKRRSNEWITGTWGFAALPTTTVSCSSQYQFCNKEYIDAVVVAGGSPASYSTPGLGFIATGLQIASTTATTTYLTVDYPNFLSAANSTSTSNGTVSALKAIITNNAGKLAQSFLDLTATFNFSGLLTFSGGFLNTASSTFDAGTLHIGSVANNTIPVRQFGGTGADGALSISSLTTTLDLGGAAYYEKNYTSISITGTGNLAFSNPSAVTGARIVLRSQGDCTITTSSSAAIDLRLLGGGPGNSTAPLQDVSGGGGIGGGGGGSTAGPGVKGASRATVLGSFGGPILPALTPAVRTAPPGGNGTAGTAGTGGGSTAGAAGVGAGGLYLECAGAYNFTTGTILASGSAGTAGGNSGGTIGGGGGGGGGGGNILVLYGSLTADSGTYTVTAGSGGGGGTGGTSAGTDGGSGGAGSTKRALNTWYY